MYFSTMLVSEIYSYIADLIDDKDRSILDAALSGKGWKHTLWVANRNTVEMGLFGIWLDLTFGIWDMLGGPTADLVKNIFAASRKSIGAASGGEAFIDLMTKEVAPIKQAKGMADAVDRVFNEKNITDTYGTWKSRSNSYSPVNTKDSWLSKASQETRDAVLATGLDSPDYAITEKTLPYQLIARNLLVGDIEDAADMIVRVVENTRPADFDGIKASLEGSMRANSPLGDLSREDMGLMLSQYKHGDRVQALQAQIQWYDNYAEAIEMADKELTERGIYTTMSVDYAEYQDAKAELLDIEGLSKALNEVLSQIKEDAE
jgi:hypothetical protein